jgi:hypothetical protein
MLFLKIVKNPIEDKLKNNRAQYPIKSPCQRIKLKKKTLD